MAGIIEVKDQGKLRIYDADNSNYIDIVVPSTVSSNRTITLPDDSFTVPNISGITMAQQWRITTNLAGNADPISANLEIVDTDGYASIGSNMTESSGTFTFPSTGIYKIEFNAMQHVDTGADYVNIIIKTTTDNSSYSAAATSSANSDGTATAFSSCMASFIFDVTNTSTHKVRFEVVQANTGNDLVGHSGQNKTYFTFIRLGDT